MTPVYSTARGYRRHHYNRGRSYRRGRTWGFFTRSGSMLSGGTPPYFGAGQPAADSSRSWFGNETPVYLASPSPTTTTPSVTSSDTAALQAAPESGQLAIVVPRS
jgi:hypothetical protein